MCVRGSNKKSVQQDSALKSLLALFLDNIHFDEHGLPLDLTCGSHLSNFKIGDDAFIDPRIGSGSSLGDVLGGG